MGDTDAELLAEVRPRPDVAVGRVSLARRWIQKLTRPSVRLVLSNAGSQVLSMLGGLLIARHLGPAGRGQVSLVQVYDDVSTNASTLGIPLATGYFAKERVDSEARILGAALAIALVSLPVTAIGGWLVATFAFGGFPVGIQLVVWAAVGMSPLANSYLMACRMLLVARGQINALVPLQIAQMTLRLVAMLVLVVVDAFTPTSAAVAVVATGWLANLMGFWAVRVRPVRGGPIRKMLTFGVKSVPSSLARMANSRLDQMIVAPVLSASALGIYAVAVGATVLPTSVGTAIALAGFHTITGTGQFEGARTLLRRACIAISACSAANAIAIALLLEPVYGNDFDRAVIPALILLPGAAATAMFTVVAATGDAIGAPSLASWCQGVGLLVTLVGLPVLLPPLGINGAALVSSGAYSVRLAFGFWLLRRRGVRFRSA